MKPPNILLVQTDQLTPQALPLYGHPLVKTPHLSLLAETGVVFENAYCNFPLCAPSRFSMMSGLLATRIGAFDNGAEFPASVPTFAHYLRVMGYHTCLSGKMHFVGPDQHHGFEERLTTDIYPADFGMTSEWQPDLPYSRVDPSDPTPRGGMQAVTEAGIYRHTVQMDYDEEASFHATRWLVEKARSPDSRPFLMVVSLTHPHDPFSTTREYWDRYDHGAIAPPTVGELPPGQRDPQSNRLRAEFGIDRDPPTPAQVLNARHAYYGSISYVDDLLARLVATLD